MTTDDLATSRSVAQQLHLDYPILSDKLGNLGMGFGIYRGSGHMGSADQHSMFVLDATGAVRWKEISPSMHVHLADVIAAARAA